MGKKFSNIIWFAAFAVFVMCCLVTIYIHSADDAKEKWAVIYQGDTEIKRINLSAITENYDFSIECDSGINIIHAEHGKVCISYADCPDKTCVKQGYINNSSLPIVCLPHKLSVVIENTNGEYDVVSGGVIWNENK